MVSKRESWRAIASNGRRRQQKGAGCEKGGHSHLVLGLVLAVGVHDRGDGTLERDRGDRRDRGDLALRDARAGDGGRERGGADGERGNENLGQHDF